MKQRWRKLGLVFAPSGLGAWAISDAALPCPLPLGGSRVRVFFGSRNEQNVASIGFVDFDVHRPRETLCPHPGPVLTKGDLGLFDDSGVWPSWVLPVGDVLYLYYIGWNLGVTVPFRNFAGLAISRDGGLTFTKHSRAPVLDRSDVDPYFCTGPCVIAEPDGWRAWYLSCLRWERDGKVAKHFYHLKYATSADGIKWHRDGHVAIDFAYPQEYAISAPCVRRQARGYQMWYSHRASPRGETYRIGYAESADGVSWQRFDADVDLDVSADGWDSEMIAYGRVFDVDGARYMVYNGNGYGRTGFGLAVLED